MKRQLEKSTQGTIVQVMYHILRKLYKILVTISTYIESYAQEIVKDCEDNFLATRHRFK